MVLDKQHHSLVMFIINQLDSLGHSGWEKKGQTYTQIFPKWRFHGDLLWSNQKKNTN